MISDYRRGTGGRKLAPIIGSAVNQILDFLTHACQKKSGRDARASGSHNRSKMSCDRSEVKIYLLNFKSTKIKFSNYYFGRSKIGNADNRKR